LSSGTSHLVDHEPTGDEPTQALFTSGRLCWHRGARPSRAARPFPQSRNAKPGFGRTVASLASVNVTLFVAALITGPLQGHALGPIGRGEVAEVLVPVALAAVVCEFGLGMFATREVARGRSVGLLLGTVGGIFLAIGAVVGFSSNGLATLIVGHRQPLHQLLMIGLILVPLGLLSNLTTGMCIGLEEWRAYNLSRLIPPVGAVIAMLVLFVLQSLTVTTAVTVSFVMGALALVPPIWALRRGGRLRFDPRLAREGLRFGSKSWLSTLLGSTAAQVVQLIMIAFVGPLQLGLFAVAVNVASSGDMLSTSVSNAIFPRVAAGDHALTARAARVTLLLVGTCCITVGLVSPIVVPLAFGKSFSGSVPMVEILLIAVMSAAANSVYSGALIGAGRPGILAIGDGLSLAILAPSLVLLLPVIGGIGAPVAYTTASIAVTIYLVYWCHKLFEISPCDLFLVKRSDLRWSGRQVILALHRIPWLSRHFPRRTSSLAREPSL
jgi:O-antigen/teichoic acid export membrane protein